MKKKVLTLVLAIAMVFSVMSVAFAGTQAIYTKSKIIVDGAEVSFEAYNIGGNNYFKLRDVAMAISGTSKQFEVSWNEGRNAVEMTSNTAYTQTGGELVQGDGQNKTATLATQKFIKDGADIEFNAYNIKGNNYIKLRDLGVAFRFEVYWDAKNNSVVVDTSREYTGISPVTEETDTEKIPYYEDFPRAIDFGAVIGAPVLDIVRENSDMGYITMYVYEKSYVTEESFAKYTDILAQEGYYYLEYDSSLILISPEADVVILSWDEEFIVAGVVEEPLAEELFNAFKERVENEAV